MKKSTEKKYRGTKRDQYTIVLEDLRSDFRVFGDGLQFVRDRVEGLETRFDGLENKFDGLGVKVDCLDQKVTTGFADLRMEIKGLRKDVDHHDREIKELQVTRR